MVPPPTAPGEKTPLLPQGSSNTGDESEHAALLALEETMGSSGSSRVNFRRSTVARSGGNRNLPQRGSARGPDARTSIRVPENLFPSKEAKRGDVHQLRPIDALAPLVAGGIIVATDGYKTVPHPPSSVKSLPAYVPFRRMARHRSFTLWWINEFRHWWKSR